MSDQSAPRQATIRSLGHGRFAIDDGDRRRVAFAARQGQTTWVFLDGVVHEIGDRQDGGESRSGAHDDDGHPSAPMPATVVAVDVVPGQRVARGDVMIRLEAMKMELPITAPRDAVVVAVRCATGEIVQPGVPLVDLE